MASRREWLLLVIIAGVVAVDQGSKALVRQQMAVLESVPVIDGMLWLTHIENNGAAFSILRGQQWLLIATAVMMLAVVAYVVLHIRPTGPWVRVALAFVSGGAIGNLIDRVVSGAVTDFLDLGWFPIFNIADIALDVGVVILVVLLLFKGDHAFIGHHTHDNPTVPEVPHEEGEVLTVDVRTSDT
ncbi:MAG: signal peptidase II [Coriobacteriia bacterium]|nr:signal peptidase II [Coriobacteriia bacterium]